MYDDLAKFYGNQQRYKDHFYLLVKLYRLEEALDIWYEQQLSGHAAGLPEDKILDVLDYVCAGKMMSASSGSELVRVCEEPDKIIMPNISCRVKQWIDVSRIKTHGSAVLQGANSKSSELRTFVNLQVSEPNFDRNLRNI